MHGVPIPDPIRISERDLARGQEIEEKYEKPIAAWGIEHGTHRQDYTQAQWRRFKLWEATGWSANDAQRHWTNVTRDEFLAYLVGRGRIGRGDEVMAARP